jgi:transglutaminase-like putative cysteine protease
VGNQTISKFDLTIDPAPADRWDHVDYFGNPTTFFSMQQTHQALTITARWNLEVLSRNSQVAVKSTSPPWEAIRDEVHSGGGVTNGNAPTLFPNSANLVSEFCFDSHYIRRNAELKEYAEESFSPRRPYLEGVFDLMERVYRDFEYDPVATDLATPLKKVLKERRGVCQDFAHLAIGCLRSIGLPARYVSGYLKTEPPPGSPRLIGADASHAWFSVPLPHSTDWLDLDPTNNTEVNTDHITLSWGRDYDDVSPLRGVVHGGGQQGLHVAVDVIPQPEKVG